MDLEAVWEEVGIQVRLRVAEELMDKVQLAL